MHIIRGAMTGSGELNVKVTYDKQHYVLYSAFEVTVKHADVGVAITRAGKSHTMRMEGQGGDGR